jgi:hypothetical protein
MANPTTARNYSYCFYYGATMSNSPPRQSFFWVSLALFWLGLSLGLTLQQAWNPSAEQQLYLILIGGLILVGRAFLGAARAEQRLHQGEEPNLAFAVTGSAGLRAARHGGSEGSRPALGPAVHAAVRHGACCCSCGACNGGERSPL